MRLGDERKDERRAVLTRRALIMGGLQVSALALLCGRLYQLQILDSDRYSTLAEENRIAVRPVAPHRGQIVDRSGIPLAINRQHFSLTLVAEQAGDDLDRIFALLERHLGLPAAAQAKARKEIASRPAFVPVTLTDGLSWEQVAWVEVNAPDLPGVAVETGDLRDYPFGDVTAHVVGYVAAVTETELKQGDAILALPGFKIGKTGIEARYDKELRGSAGSQELEVNAVGSVVRELSHVEGQPGRDLGLTLDIGLQTFVAKRLEEERAAAAAVLDVQTGAVLALVSQPGFDANLFPDGIGTADWQRLNGNPLHPMTARATLGAYSPGSTFKMMTALAALEAKLVEPGEKIFCAGHTDLGDARFHCWKRTGHGRIALVDAMAQSCDCYFYELGQRAGIDRIAAMARRFGLGKPTGLDLSAERGGLIPDTAWKSKVLGEPWHPGETFNAAIGQGQVLVTPLQLAVMTARLVNGGRAVLPHLVTPAKPVEADEIAVDPAHLALVCQGMDAVMNAGNGTARAARIAEPEFAMGGKTGTAQVRRITTAERRTGVIGNDDLPWAERDHALFVGYAPVQAPRYAVAVISEHGGGGSHTAAPIARDILLKAQQRQSASISPLTGVNGAQRAPGPRQETDL